jgi:peptidoglycan/LPS O-acetylase OafA/YrhL
MTRPRLVELDALRGLAALSVVLFHLTTRFDQVYGHATPPLLSHPFGHYGVQFFFGLSGFVVFMTLERTRRAADFVISRGSRLYPAYWSAIAITSAVVMLGPLADLRQSPASVLLNLTMLEGFLGKPYVDGVYWTLTVELAFYVCMFGLFLLRALDRIEAILIFWLLVKWLWWLVPGLSYTAGLLLVQHDIPFFAIGICAYRLFAGESGPVRLAPVIGFALITVGVVDGAERLIVASLVGLTFLGFAGGRLRWIGWRPLAWLGGISYPLYLLHENIGFVLLATLKAASVPTEVAILFVLAACLSLAWGVSRLIERPALAMTRGAWRRRHQLAAPQS